ncbi:related to transcription initiation factor TFIID subunit [Phialocephala subalpina]|uniref:Related to transcription initiation factor TFIID subunit n=1 Tax=Phialocephala subalpina TaxID=576137 RepID=A0A1L7XLT2_9HELO|nr:related to transcription initiation factor TFIID subunit [Phialocephala subalpina]
MSGLKLKLNTNGIPKAPSQDTPLATPGGSKPRIKLSIKSNPSTPAPAPSDNPKLKKTKAGRPSKPSQKLLESKKRIKVETDTEEEDDGGTISVQQPATKKVKLTFGAPKTPAPSRTPVTPVVFKTKSKVGKPPPRDPGTGYDSEASDREIDPVIEEQFVLRMPPGDDCEYVRKMIEEKKIGIPKAQGGADISMKFFELRGRRGAVTVRGNIYAATLVDLPSITEGMKSWDKRGWWKSADICQMLLVFAPVKSEEEARTIALPDEIDRDTHQYPHGLTPPMHFARQRRFRKRLHKSTIERVEEEVQRLLKADESAVSSSYEIIDPDAEERRASHFDHFDAESNSGYGHDDEEDAEGEEDDQDQGYFNHQPVNSHEEEVEDDPDLEREMEEAFADELEAPTPDVAETPLALPAAEPEEDSGDESFDDEDDGEEAAVVPAELDEEQKQEQARIDGIREDIAELKRALWSNEQNLSRSTNALIRKRLEDTVRTQKRELNLKMSSIGEGEENE